MTTAVATPAQTSPQPPTVSRRGSHIGPVMGAVSLVVGATLNTTQSVLATIIDRPDEVADQIALANERTALVVTLCVVGTVAVPFMAVGFLAACQELARRSRKVARVAGTFLVLGMWGFLAVQIAELVQLSAMLDPDGATAATYLHGLDESLMLGVLFGLPFMVGTVLGMLVLSIGLLVRGGVPRWIPGAWLTFILLDFTIGNVGPVDPHWLYLAGAAGLATHLLRGRAAARR